MKVSVTMSHADEGTLHAYLDGELTPVERAGLEAHLAACPACRARLAEERDLVERAQGLLARAAPPEAAPRPRRRPLPRWVPLAWAASVLLALGGGWMARGGSTAAGPEAPGSVALDRAEPAPIRDSAGRDDAPADLAVRERDAVAPAEPAAPGVTRARDAAAAKASAEEERAARIGAAPVDEAGRVAAAPAAAPAPAPRAEAVGLAASVTTANADAAVAWASVTVDSARAILGAEPVTIPGVPVRRYGVSGRGDGVVLVEQLLAGTTVVQLYERRADAALNEVQQAAAPARQAEGAGARAAAPSERLARYVGPLRIEIAGPVGADSLSRLLGRVR
jgi:hypothetical protein